MVHIPHLKKSRHGVYYWRVKTSTTDTAISLRTKDKTEAIIRAIPLLMSQTMPDDLFLKNIRRLEINTSQGIFKSDGSERDNNDLLKALELLTRTGYQAPTVSQAVTPPRQQSKKFSEVVSFYLEEKKLTNRDKTIQEKESKFKEFELLFNDPDILSIIDETAISYKQRLISNGLTTARINKSISFFNDLFNYAITSKYYTLSNPFEKLAISKKGRKRQVNSYQAFSDDELKLIFNSKDDYFWYASAHRKIKTDFYWLPMLAIFTGARIGELASLTVENIKQENNIWYFDITEQDDTGVKNDNSVRKVPIHKKLIELGFLKYIQGIKSGLIFPHLITAKSGYAKNTSRRFNEDYLVKLKINNPQKKFHSFRSTFINRMTYLNVHPAILQSLVGHYEQSKVDFSSAHFSVYQQQKPITVLKEVIDHLEYKGINFPTY